MKGRETHGIVNLGEEAEKVKQEIREKLLGLIDEKENVHPVKDVYDRNKAYTGPYVQEAPDLIIGFRIGYRTGWVTVTGGIGDEVIQDNQRPWSGDHNMNPSDIPGILFCNRTLDKEEPHIQDIGPTILDLFGVPVPNYCDGQSIMRG